jgi:poly(hydroxyalkanoate) granule-associated protein
MMTVKHVQDLAMGLPDDLMHAGRQVWLAGLGAAGMARNTGETVVGMLVDEGKKLHKMEVKTLDKMMDNAADTVKTMTKYVEDAVEDTAKLALNRLGMPSRKDVSALTRRVDQLATKVETMGKARKGATRGRR